MTLAQLFERLSYGEFSQLGLVNTNTGILKEEHWNRVLTHINAGLTSIYSKFLLKENQLILQLSPDTTVYYLNSDFAESNTLSTEPVKYILDSVLFPFQDDLIKIIEIKTADDITLPLNDSIIPYSAKSVRSDVLQFPEKIVTQDVSLPIEYITNTVKLFYQANHPSIIQGVDYFDPSEIYLELPTAYINALLYFVASQVTTPMGASDSGRFHAGNNYAAKYVAECQQLLRDNVGISTNTENTRASRNGWA